MTIFLNNSSRDGVSVLAAMSSCLLRRESRVFDLCEVRSRLGPYAGRIGCLGRRCLPEDGFEAYDIRV